ncbi:hypothetical protein SIN8267_00130 [Sinobacterium norvegicum]|uniref:DUF885 domain-containing protein n=1 Tax=Sinobacterium norvegicum TaxID=1641715 RepID=A0ABM9AA48_9GAMM|nr:DUF885 family protein [Sinobacterium norvegicum]CAH0990047.1 hypothetical protein SIN8267_00130 [Sinobacterium norvegicum]
MTNFATIEQQFKDFVLADADTSMALGATDHLGQLGDPSLAAAKTRDEAAKTLLQQLQSAETEGFDQQLDLDLMQRYLQQALFFDDLQQHGQPQRRRAPGGVDGISAGIFQLFVNDERPAEQRLDNILSRLLQAPHYLAVEAEVITQPIARWRDIELDQGAGIADLLATIVDWAAAETYPQLGALKSAVIACNTALDSYLADLAGRDAKTNFAIGEEKVCQLLALRNIQQSPAQLAAMAATFMAETKALLAELTVKLNRKYQLAETTTEAELHEYLNQRFAATLKDGRLDSILDHYTDQISDINDFVSDRQLFALPEQQQMKILQTPGFLEPVIPAGAMWPPLALRPGSKTSLVYLTLKEDQLAEHTALGIPVMMIHEGIPGHHLQFATAAQHPSFIRRIFSANEHAEGWTTMLEDYMLDVGYIADDLVDEVRFIAKREMSRLVARVGIDLYFMTANKDYLNVGLDLDFDSDDVFVNAAKLLKEATGFTDGRVQAELNWYSTEQSYPLSYLTGNRLVWQLKQDIQQANRKELNSNELDRAFHKVYLQSGCMPVENLRLVFNELGYL